VHLDVIKSFIPPTNAQLNCVTYNIFPNTVSLCTVHGTHKNGVSPF